MRTLLLGSLKLLMVAILVYLAAFLTLYHMRRGEVRPIHWTGQLLLWKGGATYQRFAEFRPEERYDVLVMGSSLAYRGYDPRHFQRRGYTAFNLGSTAQTPTNTWPLVRRYVHAQRTGLLLVDVNYSVVSIPVTESVADLVQNLADDRAALDQALLFRDPRVINMLAMRWAARNDPPRYRADDYVGSGYCSLPDSAKDGADYPVTGAYVPVDGHMDHLLRIADHAERIGVPVVFVSHPMPRQADTVQHKAFAEELRARLGAGGPPYIDLALDHGLDDGHHFADHGHLNQAGVDRFDPRLIDSLEALGLLRRAGH